MDERDLAAPTIRQSTRPGPRGTRLAAGLAFSVASLGIIGCSTPFADDTDRMLREAVESSVQRELAEAQTRPDRVRTSRQSRMGELGIDESRMQELAEMAGVDSYRAENIELDEDLLGRPQATVLVSLEHAVRTGIEGNLSLTSARLTPAIREAELVAAEAAFDWSFFASAQYQETDLPQTVTVSGFGSPFNAVTREVRDYAVGFQKNLTTGGTLTIDALASRNDDRFTGLVTAPDPGVSSSAGFEWRQPLLRGGGSDIALAPVRLARNAERDALATLESSAQSTVQNIENAYWTLVQAHRNLLIQERLLERGEETLRQIRARERLDVNKAQIANAVSSIERRRGDVIEARNSLRLSSDQLKTLMNDPALTVGSEVLILPSDMALDEPVEFSLVDSVRTGLERRPEIRRAILAMDDTSIRLEVAENGRLPQLDLTLQSRLNGLADEEFEAFFNNFQDNFVSYLAGLQYSRPIGNRAAEASFRQRNLERVQAATNYRQTVQQIVFEVKGALRDVVTNYRLIEQSRVSRVAASEDLRALLVQIQTTSGYSASNLDLLLRRQEALAAAELEEVVSMVNYNRALAELFLSMGTILDRNRIEFRVEEPLG